ncbi:MAG: hypothetical protein AAGA10_20745 [Bacteroidota bacterium]
MNRITLYQVSLKAGPNKITFKSQDVMLAGNLYAGFMGSFISLANLAANGIEVSGVWGINTIKFDRDTPMLV